MTTIHLVLTAAVGLILAQQTVGFADPAPVISDVSIQSLKGYTYAFVSTQATLNALLPAIDKLIPQLDQAIDTGKIRQMGPVVFTYHGATADRDKTFTLDVGVIVKDGTAKPDGFQLITVPPLHCATLLYTGAVTTLGQAYGKLYGEIGRRGLQPTDICREVYLYWEDRQSPNNILQLQVDLAPTAPTN